MEIQEFIEKFADELGVDDSLTPETDFTELDEWNSMAVVNIIVLIDELFGKSVSAIDIRKCSTIEDLYNLCKFQ